MNGSRIKLGLAVLVLFLSTPSLVLAHCDTVDGPVVKDAKMALNRGDVTPVLKWVKQEDETEIRGAFQRTLRVRALSPETREQADNYFFETLVRVHRAGEGAPFTGVKPAGTPAEPGIALADRALQTGSSEELVRQVTAAVAASIRRRFAEAEAAGKHADDSVMAGRAYVAAYVEFIHFIERLEQAAAAPAHSHSEPAGASELHRQK
jgi:hypothetical protein